MGSFPGRSSEFLCGMILATAVKSTSAWLIKIPYKTMLGFLGMFLSMYIIGFFQQDIYHHGYDNPIGMLLSKTILPLSMMVLLAGLIYEKTQLQRILGSKFLVLLGNASFSFYLIHISYVNLKLKDWFLLPDRNFIVLWMISIILYKYLESPIYNFCRKLLMEKGVDK